MVKLGASPCIALGQIKISEKMEVYSTLKGFLNYSLLKNGSEFLKRIINDFSQDYTDFDK